MAWKLVISDTAERQLSNLDRSVSKTAKKYLTEVCQLADPADRGHPLTGKWAGFHRYRVDQLRLIVEIDRNVITLTLAIVDRRDSVY